MEENKKLLQGIFDRMAEGDTRGLVDAMSDDFRWVFPGNWSWSGAWEPKRVVLDGLLRPLMAQLVDYRSEADGRLTELVEHCDTALVERVLERPGA